jgi:hypothetical protein
MSLPQIFTKLISISIRKQIKEYVFDLVQNFTQNFENMKKEYMSRKKAPSEDILKKYGLTDSLLSLDTLSTSTSLRKRNTSLSSIPNYLQPKPQLPQIPQLPQVPLKNIFAMNKSSVPLFATFSNFNIPNQAAPIEAQVPPKVFKSYHENVILNDPLVKLDDKLNKPLPFIFDNKLEKILGKKSHRSRLSNEFILPEFLKNKIPPPRKESEVEEKALSSYSGLTPSKSKKNNNVVHISSSNKKSSRKTSKEVIVTESKEKIKILNPIRIPLSDSAIKSRLNHKKSKDASRKNSIIIIDKPNFRKEILPEIHGEPNPHVISYTPGVITIKKEVLKYAEYYEKIVIDKSIFKNCEYDFFKENLKVENELQQQDNNEEIIEIKKSLNFEICEENKKEYSYSVQEIDIEFAESILKNEMSLDIEMKQENFEEMKKIIDFKSDDIKETPMTDIILDEIKQELKIEDFFCDQESEKKNNLPDQILDSTLDKKTEVEEQSQSQIKFENF